MVVYYNNIFRLNTSKNIKRYRKIIFYKYSYENRRISFIHNRYSLVSIQYFEEYCDKKIINIKNQYLWENTFTFGIYNIYLYSVDEGYFVTRNRNEPDLDSKANFRSNFSLTSSKICLVLLSRFPSFLYNIYKYVRSPINRFFPPSYLFFIYTIK